jgi:hypothetical protein
MVVVFSNVNSDVLDLLENMLLPSCAFSDIDRL